MAKLTKSEVSIMKLYRGRIGVPRSTICLFLLAGLFAGIGSSSRAGLLNLTPLAGVPDFMAGFINLTYSATTSLLQAQGFTTDYANGSVSLAAPGSYSLTAIINTSGLLTSGTVTIQGDVGNGTETLLTGTLNTGASGTGFGSMDPPGGSLFDFTFNVTGGNPWIIHDFGGLGAAFCGISLDAWFENGGVAFNGSWSADFYNDGVSGTAETFAAAPEPSLMGVAGLLLVGAAAKYGKRFLTTDGHG